MADGEGRSPVRDARARGPPRGDRIVSIDPEHRLRWQLEVTPVDWAFGPPIIGLDGTVLFVHGQTLLAIE